MKARIPGILLLVLTALLLGSVLAFELHYADRVYPGVWVWGTDVGGMQPEEAAAALRENLGIDMLLVTLRGPDRSWGVRPADLGVQIDTEATLAPAAVAGVGDNR